MRNGLPALGGGESSRQIRMSTHLYSKRKVCNPIFIGYKLIIRGGELIGKHIFFYYLRCGWYSCQLYLQMAGRSTEKRQPA